MFQTLLEVIANPIDRTMANLLHRERYMAMDAHWEQCSNGTMHLMDVETGLPNATKTGYYSGAKPSIGTEVTLRETTMNIENVCAISETLAHDRLKSAAGDEMALMSYRMKKGERYVEKLGQTQEDHIIYGSKANAPDEIDGIRTRFMDSSAPIAENIFTGSGGVGDATTSIYIVGWGPERVYCLYPEGSQSSIRRINEGIQIVPKGTRDAVTGDLALETYRAYQERFQMRYGFAVHDWRYLAGLINIKVADLFVGASATKDLIVGMVAALERLQSVDMNTCIYMSRQTATALRLVEIKEVRGGGNLTFQNLTGRRYRKFDDVKVNISDEITNKETFIAPTGAVAWNAIPSGFSVSP